MTTGLPSIKVIRYRTTYARFATTERRPTISLPVCGTCGQELGLSARCDHQPLPTHYPVNPEPDWLEELLADAMVMEAGPVAEFDPSDLEVVITGSRGGLSLAMIRGW